MSPTQMIQIERPDPTSLVAQFSSVAESAKDLVVCDRETHEQALQAMATCRKVEKKITEHFEPARAALDKAKKELISARDSLIGPFVEARALLAESAGSYERRERERVEAERVAAEKKAREEADERARAQQAAAEAAALEAEKAGDAALAERLIEKAVEAETAPAFVAPLTPFQPRMSKVAGVSTRENWKAEVTDKMALIRFVAEHPEWAAVVEPSMTTLNQLARTAKGTLTLPGVRAVSETVRSFRE